MKPKRNVIIESELIYFINICESIQFVTIHSSSKKNPSVQLVHNEKNIITQEFSLFVKKKEQFLTCVTDLFKKKNKLENYHDPFVN